MMYPLSWATSCRDCRRACSKDEAHDPQAPSGFDIASPIGISRGRATSDRDLPPHPRHLPRGSALDHSTEIRFPWRK